MPTGYTAKLMKEGQGFQEFVMLCARAMGACVILRDEPLDKPIPEAFEPSPFAAEQQKLAVAEASRLKAMSPEERTAFGEEKKQAEIRRINASIAKSVSADARLAGMAAKVEAWTPPSEDHVGLKKFMLEQLDISHEGTEYEERALAAARDKTPEQFWEEALAAALGETHYYATEQEKESERVAGRNDWLRQLRDSL